MQNREVQLDQLREIKDKY